MRDHLYIITLNTKDIARMLWFNVRYEILPQILYLKFQKMIMSHVIYTTMINIFARGGMGMFPIDSKAPKEATLFGETG